MLFLTSIQKSYTQESIVMKVRFPYTTSLRSKAFKVQDVVIGKMPALVVTNDFVIVLRTFTEPLYQIFSLPDCKYLGGIGHLGKGPVDFELPDARTGMRTKEGFKIFDVNKGYIYVNLLQYKKKKGFDIKVIKMPGELYVLNDPIQLNDNVIIGLPEMWKTNKMYVRYNIQAEKITYFGEYPAVFPERYRHLYWGAYWRHSVSKPDGTKFASFFDEVKMFRIYNDLGNIEVEKVMKIFNLFKGNNFSKKPKKYYYKTVRADNRYIYALCLDAYRNKLLDSYPSIEIWDWNGNPIASIKLDHHIKSFDITPDGKGIYAMDREISNEIFYYDLNFNY